MKIKSQAEAFADFKILELQQNKEKYNLEDYNKQIGLLQAAKECFDLGDDKKGREMVKNYLNLEREKLKQSLINISLVEPVAEKYLKDRGL